MAGEARFVKLDEVHAKLDQSVHLAVDNGDQRFGDFAAVLVYFAALQATGQRERSRHRHFHGRRSDAPQPSIFVGQTESLRCLERSDTAVAITLVVGRRAPAPRLRQWFDADEIIVKAEIEI